MRKPTAAPISLYPNLSKAPAPIVMSDIATMKKPISQRPAWPPGPGDADGWERFLRSAPDLEPAVRRGADGVAHKVDRLRLCGNGVVPLVAAHAFRILAARFGDDG
jgi:hypothetical protein